VPPEDSQAYRGSLALRVGEGQRLFGTNRLPEALMVADSVLASDPDHVAALALKGDVLERMGDIAGALACYESVVTLHPESPLDRIRVSQLRKRISQRTQSRPGDRSSLSPVWAGLAACVLVVAVGAALALASQPRSRSIVATLDEPTAKVSQPFMSPGPVPSNPSPSVSGQSKPPAKAQSQPEDEQDDAVQTVNQNRRLVTERRPAAAVSPLRGGLPSPLIEEDDAGFQPLEVKVTPESAPRNQAATPDPQPEAVHASPSKDTVGRDPRGGSVIDIRPSPGQEAARTGGSEAVASGDRNQGEALVRVARQHFLARDYEKAAVAYRRAIDLGVSPASAYHRLAQCYKNLGRTADAVEAYQNAINAYETLLAGGRGDRELLENYVSECRQAIKLLQ
jgi:tetratricopeptide (TPR) repeat protein